MTTDTTKYVTEEGLAKLQDELNHLKTSKRLEIANRIASAKELGDLSENAEYSDAKEEQGLVESRVLELEDILRNVQIISKPSQSNVVSIGCTITVEDSKGTAMTYQIVGSNEANPAEGKISNESPLGSSFLGKKVDDVITVKVPKGEFDYTIKKIG